MFQIREKKDLLFGHSCRATFFQDRIRARKSKEFVSIEALAKLFSSATRIRKNKGFALRKKLAKLFSFELQSAASTHACHSSHQGMTLRTFSVLFLPGDGCGRICAWDLA
jgi:hypothetical protein